MEDAPLKGGQMQLDERLALGQQSAGVHTAIGRHFLPGKLGRAEVVEGLKPRPRASEAAVHLVSGDPEDPYQEGRVSGVRGKAAEDRDENLLGDVFGLSGVPEALHRKTKDAREVRLVEEIEVLTTPGQNLGHELRVARPRLLCVRQDVLSHGRLLMSRAMSASEHADSVHQPFPPCGLRAHGLRGFSWRIDTQSAGSTWGKPPRRILWRSAPICVGARGVHSESAPRRSLSHWRAGHPWAEKSSQSSACRRPP